MIFNTPTPEPMPDDIIEVSLAQRKKELRDRFAIAAMRSLIPAMQYPSEVAKIAYEHADAMMKERER